MRAFVLALIALLSAGCGEDTTRVVLDGRTMGTTWTVTLRSTSGEVDAPAVHAAIETTLERINARMSTYRPESELSRFNDAASTDWIAVSGELHRVVAAAQDVAALSGGAFDVTVGELVDLWGFGPAPMPEAPPPDAAITEALARAGYRKLETRASPPALRKADPGLRVDLSGIAKGYAVDAIAALLDGMGHLHYLIDIGGEVRGRGERAPGEPWRAGIVDPDGATGAPVAILPVADTAVATSGDYRNYRVDGGRRRSHEIDPATGAPAERAPASVTVIHPSCMLADAWATGFMVLGRERALAVAEAEALAVMIVEREAGALRIHRSSAMERMQGQPRPATP